MQLTPDQLKKQVENIQPKVEINNSKPIPKPLQSQNNRPISQNNIRANNNPAGAKPSIYRRNSPNQ